MGGDIPSEGPPAKAGARVEGSSRQQALSDDLPQRIGQDPLMPIPQRSAAKDRVGHALKRLAG